MKITLEIPEAEFKRYKQYYEPWVVKEPITTADTRISGHGACIDCGWFGDHEGCNADRDSEGCLRNRSPRQIKVVADEVADCDNCSNNPCKGIAKGCPNFSPKNWNLPINK